MGTQYFEWWSQYPQLAYWMYIWPNPTKPGTSHKTCFWVNSRKRWLAQNYFQIFKFVFSCLLSGEQCILSNAWKNLFKWDFFQTIIDGLSLLIPIHSLVVNGKLTGPFLRSVVRQKYVDATYKISRILRNVYVQTWSWCHFNGDYMLLLSNFLLDITFKWIP